MGIVITKSIFRCVYAYFGVIGSGILLPIKSLVDLSDEANSALYGSFPRGLVKVAYEAYNDGVKHFLINIQMLLVINYIYNDSVSIKEI